MPKEYIVPEVNLKNYFGTDGIRGNEKIFTPEFIGAVVRAIAVYYGKPEIMIGRDPRRSGKRITELFAAAATAEGMRVTDAGMVPQPSHQEHRSSQPDRISFRLQQFHVAR